MQQQPYPHDAEEITFDYKKAAATVAQLKSIPASELSKGNLAYYKERHARQIQTHLDSVLALPEDQWKDKTLIFDCRKLRQNSRTLQQRIHWAWHWLIINDDPAGKYAHLRKMYRIRRRPGCVFLKYSYVEELTSALIDADIVEQTASKTRITPEGKRISQRTLIMEEVENFVINAPDGESIVRSETLTDADISMISDFILPFMDTVAVVQLDKDGYRMIKNPALAKRLAQERQ